MSVADEAAPLDAAALDVLRPRERFWDTLIRWSRRDARIPFFAAVLIVMFGLCLLAPLIAPYAPKETHSSDRLASPSRKYLLGTDQLGRDTFSRVLYGGRVSLPAGLMAVAISAATGVVLGVITGYAGGIIDMLVGRWVDAQLAFPGLLLLIALVSAFGRSLLVVMVVVGFANFPLWYRLTRGQVLQTREFDYVNAARALGATTPRLMFLHVLPNSLNPLVVQSSLSAGGAVLVLANLSFLGLGPSGGNADWGAMFLDGLTNFRLQPWLVVGPGVCVFLAVLSFYMLGDALRDVLDPRQRGARRA